MKPGAYFNLEAIKSDLFHCLAVKHLEVDVLEMPFVNERRQQFLFHGNKRKARLSLAVLMDLSGPPILLEKTFEKQVGQKVKKTITSSKVLNRKA